jgi:hypothetical protein
MSYPSELWIRGVHYSVEYVTNSREVQTDFDSASFAGVCDNVTYTLRVHTDQAPMEVIDTLVHEVIHAILNRNRTLKACIRGSEEDFVHTLAIDVAQFLVENGLMTLEEKPPVTTRLVRETD